MIEQLRALIARHCETLTNELSEIEASLNKLEHGDAPVLDVLREGIEKSHKVKGSSGTIGFAEISDLAAELEAFLRLQAGKSGAMTSADHVQINAKFQRLSQAIEQVSPEQSSLFNSQFPAASHRAPVRQH